MSIFINDDLFDIIQSTHQDRNVLWRLISNELNEDESHSESTEKHKDKIQNKKRTANKYSTNHTLQRKRKNQLTIKIIHLMNSG